MKGMDRDWHFGYAKVHDGSAWELDTALGIMAFETGLLWAGLRDLNLA